MVKQNDPKCLPIVQKIGCFVRACGYMAEYVTGEELTASQINELWAWAKKSQNVDYKNEVKHSAPIATHALRMLGNERGQFIEIATFTKGKMNYYASVGDGLKRCPKYYIQKIATNGEEGTHFRNIDNEGKLLFDPHKPDINCQGIFYSIVYCYREI